MNPHLQYAREIFGLGLPVPRDIPAAVIEAPPPGRSLVLVGPSGAGKSRALDALARRTPGARLALPLSPAELERPVLSLFDASLPSGEVLRCLARLGLADATLWGRRAAELSAGERRRLEIARALVDAGRGALLVLDELDAHLDDTTARVLAVNLRRVVESLGLRLAASTHRPSLLPRLGAGRVTVIDDGVAEELQPPKPRPSGALLEEIAVVRGRALDYEEFSRWHYLGSGRPGPCELAVLALHDDRPVGIAIFSRTHLLLSARRLALPPVYWPENVSRHGSAALNHDVRLLSRVVVNPRFRGIGVAGKLIAHGLREINVPYVECLSQMGAFAGFLTAAGFRRIGLCPVPRTVCRLRRLMAAHRITQADLLDPVRRNAVLERLGPGAREDLHRALRAAMRTRVQTGHGALRKAAVSPFERPAMLASMLSRLQSQPAYYLWTGED